MRAALRPGDRFVACELHPQDALTLKREFAGDQAVEVRQADGYHALKAMLPPVERRGLMLIDPPFEAADEFDRLARAVKQALRRFAIGCYAIWYPIKDEEAVAGFVAGLAGLKAMTLELRLPAIGRGQAVGLRAGGDQSAVEVRGGDGRGAAVGGLGAWRNACHGDGSGMKIVRTNDTKHSAAPPRIAPV